MYKKLLFPAFLIVGLLVALQSASADTFSRPLTVGSQGKDVSILQTYLKAQNYFTYPTITGYFGSFTWKAVAEFQTSNNLESVGYVGPKTRALLNSIFSAFAVSTTTGTSTASNISPPASTTCAAPVGLTCFPGTAIIQPVAPGNGYTPGFGGGGSNPPPTTNVTAPADTTAPIISSIGSTIVSTTTAIVTWITNEGADSQIEYGTTAAYGSMTILNSSLVTSHSVVLSGLLPDYTYHYRIRSSDAQGNVATSSDQTLSTLSAYGAGTFFADTFERNNTSPSASPGSIGNNWIDKSGNTYFINNGQLNSTNYAWEQSLYREFPDQSWDTSDLYGYVDLPDASASSTRILVAYATTTSFNFRTFHVSFGPNGGYRYMAVGTEYNVDQFYGDSANWRSNDAYVPRLAFSLTDNGATFTGIMLDMADPNNPIVLGQKSFSRVGPYSLDYNVLGIAGNLPINQLVLTNTTPTWASWSSDHVAYNNAALYYAPNNWYDTGSSYRTSDVGAYVKFKFTGTRIAVDINADHSSENILGWQIDGGEIKTHPLPYSSSGVSSISLAQGLTDTTHTITIYYGKEYDYAQDRWTVDNTSSVEITGFDIDSGKTVSAPDIHTKKVLFYGDSITETAVPGYSWQSWAPQLANLMGWEYGQVGFSYQGWTFMLSSTNIGTFQASWPYYYATNSRLSGDQFVSQPDYIFINEGQNDYSLGGNNPTAVTDTATSTITAIRAAAPSAKIFIVIPFTGNMRSAITTAFNDYQTDTPDSNCFLIDLGLNGPPTYDSSDDLHPTPTGAANIAGLMQTAVNGALGL